MAQFALCVGARSPTDGDYAETSLKMLIYIYDFFNSVDGIRLFQGADTPCPARLHIHNAN